MTQTQTTDNSVANFVQKAFQIINVTQSAYRVKNIRILYNGLAMANNSILKTFKDLRKAPKHPQFHKTVKYVRFSQISKGTNKKYIQSPMFSKKQKVDILKCRQLLGQVRRKMKLQENETPQKIKNIQNTQLKIAQQVKQTAVKQPTVPSSCSITLKSINILDKDQLSPFKSFLVSKSFILDVNPQVCLKLRDHTSFIAQEEEQQDDNLSIADQINRERQKFNNRTQGISIVKTSNFFEQFQF